MVSVSVIDKFYEKLLVVWISLCGAVQKMQDWWVGKAKNDEINRLYATITELTLELEQCKNELSSEVELKNMLIESNSALQKENEQLKNAYSELVPGSSPGSAKKKKRTGISAGLGYQSPSGTIWFFNTCNKVSYLKTKNLLNSVFFQIFWLICLNNVLN